MGMGISEMRKWGNREIGKLGRWEFAKLDGIEKRRKWKLGKLGSGEWGNREIREMWEMAR